MADATTPTLPTLDELRDGAVLFHDASRVRVVVSGDDRFTWLNGAASADVNALAKKPGVRAAYACVLTVKGKILGDAYVIADGEALAVWLPRDAREAIVAQWEKYIVMEDVELSVDEGRALLFVIGGRAGSIADTVGLAARAGKLDELGVGGGLVLEVPAGEVLARTATLNEAGARSIDEASLRALRTEAGRATFGVDFDGQNYVQEAGLEKRAVSFTKGCYVGQEVVCMLQMRGHVHRKLARLSFAAGASAIAAGAEVQVDGAPVGKITSVARAGDRATALAMLKYGAIEGGRAVKVGDVDGTIAGEAS